jgi:hypothetical protein
MARGRLRFTKTDLTRALRAASAAGQPIQRFEIDREGKIVVFVGKPEEREGLGDNDGSRRQGPSRVHRASSQPIATLGDPSTLADVWSALLQRGCANARGHPVTKSCDLHSHRIGNYYTLPDNGSSGSLRSGNPHGGLG